MLRYLYRPANTAPAPAADDEMPIAASMRQQLVHGSKRQQVRAAKDAADAIARVTHPDSKSEAHKHQAYLYRHALLKAPPSQREALAGYFNTYLQVRRADPPRGDGMGLIDYIYLAERLHDDVSKERFISAIIRQDFPQHGASYEAATLIKEGAFYASIFPDKVDSEVWQRFVSAVYAFCRTDHRIDVSVDVSPAGCSALEILARFPPQVLKETHRHIKHPDEWAYGNQESFAPLSHFAWQFGVLQSRGEKISAQEGEASVQAATQFVAYLMQHIKPQGTYRYLRDFEAQASAVYLVAHDGSAATTRQIFACTRQLMEDESRNPSLGQFNGGAPLTYLELFEDLGRKDGLNADNVAQLGSRLRPFAAALAAPDVAYVAQNAGHMFFKAMPHVMPVPERDIQNVVRLAAALTYAGGPVDTEYRAISVGLRFAEKIDQVKALSLSQREALLTLFPDALMPTERYAFGARAAKTHGQAGSLNEAVDAAIAHSAEGVDALQRFMTLEFGRAFAGRFGTGAPARDETFGFVLPICVNMSKAQREDWLRQVAAAHLELMQSNIFSAQWSTQDQLRFAEIYRRFPRGEQDATRFRLCDFSTRDDFSPTQFVNSLAILPVDEIPHALDLALRAPTDSATDLLRCLNDIVRTPVQTRDEHARQLHQIFVGQAQQRAAQAQHREEQVRREHDLAFRMGHGQMHNVHTSRWNARIEAGLSRLRVDAGGTASIAKTMQNILRELNALQTKGPTEGLGRVRGGRTEIANAIHTLQGPMGGRDFSYAIMDKTNGNAHLQKVLARIWKAIETYDIERVAPAHATKGQSPTQLAQQTAKDRDNMRYGFIMSLAQCIEDDGSRVCGVGQMSRMVRVLQGYYPQVEIDDESQVTPNILVAQLAEAFTRSAGEHPSAAQVRAFVREADATARGLFLLPADRESFNQQLAEFIRLQDYDSAHP